MVSRLGYDQVDLDYVLDRHDRVAKVCPHWAMAARERMAMSLDEPFVLGRPLWDFVHGGATQRLYDALLHHARRTGRKIAFYYRGDSPEALRYMRMVLQPVDGGAVRFRSEMLHEQPRQREVYFTHVAYPKHPELMQCGLCQKLEHNGRWHTVDETLMFTAVIDELMPTEVGDTVCDSCVTKLELATGLRL